MAPCTGTRLLTGITVLLMQKTACCRDDERFSTIEWGCSVGVRVVDGLVDEAISRRSLYLIMIGTRALGIGDGVASAFKVSEYCFR